MARVKVRSAEEAYRYVLENVGATLPKRDEVDARIIREVSTGKLDRKPGLEIRATEFVKRRLPADSYKQGIIADVSQVGGYPEYRGTPYVDSDGDGMPDTWETRYGLNPYDQADANGDISGDGYTNIEKFINGIDPEQKVDWTDPENNKDTLESKTQIL